MGMPAKHTKRNSSGRIVGTVGLTEKQAAFVHALVANGGCKIDAARTAGYSSPKTGAYQSLQLPHVIAAIRAEQFRLMHGKLTNLSLGVIRGILEDTECSPRIRLDAAKTVLDRAGLVAPKQESDADASKDKAIGDMTVEELEDFIRRGREAMDGADKPVIDGELVDNAQNAQDGGGKSLITLP